MNPAYRIPNTPDHNIPAGSAPESTSPIARYNIRSFITSVAPGATLRAGRETVVRGIAFDGGHGIAGVVLSADGGRNWRAAKLGRDWGRYSFREWTCPVLPEAAGPAELMARATNLRGETQPMGAGWNPSGYMRNVVESVQVDVVA